MYCSESAGNEPICPRGHLILNSVFFAEGGELDMQGDMMQPQMQPEMPMGEVSQMEVQEAQQGLVQILQVIETLIQQGLSEDEIIAFLAQYGITEAELEQAAQVLGVDMEQLLGGVQMEQPQMEVPQQPMMMANGGALSDRDIAMARSMLTPDNEPMFQSRSPEEQIFSLNNRIENLMTSYEMLLRNNEFERAQEVADQIDEVQQQIIAIQSQNVEQIAPLALPSLPSEKLVPLASERIVQTYRDNVGNIFYEMADGSFGNEKEGRMGKEMFFTLFPSAKPIAPIPPMTPMTPMSPSAPKGMGLGQKKN